VEFIVGYGATVVGRPLKELNLPKECLICAYVRGNEAYIPNGDSVLEAGDRAILFIRTPHAKNVMKFFKGNE
jgi:trk system potassium uptake protein TrkA